MRSSSPLAGAGLRGAWSWWTGALASLLSPRMRSAFGLAAQRLLLARDGADLVVRLDSADAVNEAQHALAVVPLDVELAGGDPLAAVLAPRSQALPRWYALPARAGLRRVVTLPAAAADRVRDVLGFEIDRQTPFAADDVYFDARLLARRGDGQIDAELVVVPRAALDAALDALPEGLRGTLAGVELVDPDGVPLGVNLLPATQRRRTRDPRAAWNIALVAVALLATFGALVLVRSNREAAAEALATATEAREAQAKRVAAEKRQLVDLVEGMRFLQETRAGRPSMVEIIDELSRRLPDNTFLEKVSVEGDQLLVMGLSSEAPRLVQRLEGSPLWTSVKLSGAVNPDAIRNKDRFTVIATLQVKEPTQSNREKRNARAR